MSNGSCLIVPVKVTLIGWERATAEGGLVHSELNLVELVKVQIKEIENSI